MGKVIFDSTGKVWENRTFQGQVFLTYFARNRNPYNSQNSKHEKSEFTYQGKIIGKHKYFKGLGFLHIPHSFISREIETHTIPKTLENWILAARETYRSIGKHKHSKAIGFLHISCEALIHTIPKIWEKWIPIVRKKYEKTQTFQSYVFLKFFAWCRNPCSSQSMGKLDFHYTGKVWEKTNIPK